MNTGSIFPERAQIPATFALQNTTIMNRLFLLLLIPVFLTEGCALDESSLAGDWRATAFYENGQTVNTKIDSVRLSIYPDHHYQFYSQGFYQEAGTWKSSINYLFFNDTTANPPKERMLKVLFQSADSIKLKMESNGAEQVLFLGRIK